MFSAILLAIFAIGAGYYIHKQFNSPAAETQELSIRAGLKRGTVAASKHDVAVSNRNGDVVKNPGFY